MKEKAIPIAVKSPNCLKMRNPLALRTRKAPIVVKTASNPTAQTSLEAERPQACAREGGIQLPGEVSDEEGIPAQRHRSR